MKGPGCQLALPGSHTAPIVWLPDYPTWYGVSTSGEVGKMNDGKWKGKGSSPAKHSDKVGRLLAAHLLCAYHN